MDFGSSIKRTVRGAVAPLFFLAVAGYFGWSATQGGHGLKALAEQQELLAQAQDRQLVQFGENVRRQPAFICNCCGCCCGGRGGTPVPGLVGEIGTPPAPGLVGENGMAGFTTPGALVPPGTPNGLLAAGVAPGGSVAPLGLSCGPMPSVPPAKPRSASAPRWRSGCAGKRASPSR